MYTISMNTDFNVWLTKRLDKEDWNNSELARRASVAPSTVSMVLNQQQRPGLDFCLGVAKALRIPPETVLRKAGLLPPVPPAIEQEQEYLLILRELSAGTRETLLTMVRALTPELTYTAVREATPCYHTQAEWDILEITNRMNSAKLEAARETLRAIEQNQQIRIIGEPGQNETPIPAQEDAA